MATGVESLTPSCEGQLTGEFLDCSVGLRRGTKCIEHSGDKCSREGVCYLAVHSIYELEGYFVLNDAASRLTYLGEVTEQSKAGPMVGETVKTSSSSRS